MLLRLADEQKAITLLEKGLGESCMVEEWEVQKITDQKCFKCQKFAHLAGLCSGPIICGNCAKQGHSHRECLNSQILCANCHGKHRANDRNYGAKPGVYVRSRTLGSKET